MTTDNPLSAGWRDHPRYPDPAIETLDERFAQYRIFSAAVERLYTGCRWSEGPVWFGDGRYLLWSDIPNNRMLKWEEETGSVSIYRGPSDFANGNTRDRQGRLITCEHGPSCADSSMIWSWSFRVPVVSTSNTINVRSSLDMSPIPPSARTPSYQLVASSQRLALSRPPPSVQSLVDSARPRVN